MIRQLLAILCIAWCLISNAGDTPDWLRQLDATLGRYPEYVARKERQID